MRDPHVEKLHYETYSGEGISFKNPPPVSLSNQLGTFELRDGHLTVSPAGHYADPAQARAVVEPFLRAWEMEADLKGNLETIRFKFLHAETVDRNPPAEGERESQTLQVTGAAQISITGHAKLHLVHKEYPQPPGAFRSTPEVEMAFRRWKQYRDGLEPLPSMAYFILTILQTNAGGQRQAAEIYRIDYKVLNKISHLSSTKGTAATARKAPRNGKVDELTSRENLWLEAATRILIRRLGEHASGTPLKKVTLADLPSLGGD